MATLGLLAEILQEEDLILLAKSVRDFGERELVPYLRNLSAEDFPDKFLALAAGSGFLGTVVPAEFGGQGGTLEEFLPIIEGIAAYDGSCALTLAAHESLATNHILLGGNNEQKRKYLPDLVGGRKIAAWCLTEPQAGSNIFSDMKVTISRTSGSWTLSGEKTFITNGCHADLYVVLAQAIGQDGRHAGITACVIEREGNQGGIAASPLHGKMGMRRTDTAALRFDKVAVREDAILGEVGSAAQVARSVLLRGRIGVAALVLGLARDCFERATTYTKARMIGRAPLFDQQLTRTKLSQMEEGLWVAWQGVRSAARLADQSKPFKVQACMAKVFATETALRIADDAIQLLGGYGYMTDYRVEQNYRDARLLTIGEGASEILRLAIARNLETAGFGEQFMPLSEAVEEGARACGGTLPGLWSPSLKALELARNSFRVALQRIKRNNACNDLSSLNQTTAVKVAELATRLWIAGEVACAGARPVSPGNGPGKVLLLGQSFLAKTSLEVCHQSMELIRQQGLTDERLLGNYAEALRIIARDPSTGKESR